MSNCEEEVRNMAIAKQWLEQWCKREIWKRFKPIVRPYDADLVETAGMFLLTKDYENQPIELMERLVDLACKALEVSPGEWTGKLFVTTDEQVVALYIETTKERTKVTEPTTTTTFGDGDGIDVEFEN